MRLKYSAHNPRERLKLPGEFPVNSTLYQEFLREREEILKHKWYLSEKAGHDIGFERALLDWCRHHRAAWRLASRTKRANESAA